MIPDLLKPLSDKGSLDVHYVHYSRKGSEQSLYQGKSDMMMLSPKWLKKPSKLIATDAIDEHRSFLYANQPFQEGFKLDTSLSGQKLCTRQGFSYPSLTPYLNSKSLIRMDSTSHLAMMRLLFDNKCDFVVMNEFNAYNLSSSAFFDNAKLYPSPIPVSIVPLSIILRPDLIEVKGILDRHIKSLRDSGEMQKLLVKHAKNKR